MLRIRKIDSLFGWTQCVWCTIYRVSWSGEKLLDCVSEWCVGELTISCLMYCVCLLFMFRLPYDRDLIAILVCPSPFAYVPFFSRSFKSCIQSMRTMVNSMFYPPTSSCSSYCTDNKCRWWANIWTEPCYQAGIAILSAFSSLGCRQRQWGHCSLLGEFLFYWCGEWTETA